MPDFRIRCHGEEDVSFDTPLLRYLHRKKLWAFLSDYLRLRILYEQGGVYLDVDVEAVRSFGPLLRYPLFLGYESAGRLNSAVIGSRKGHPFLRVCMELMETRFAEGRPLMIAPEVMTAAHARFSDGVVCLPEEAFYPFNPYDSGRAPEAASGFGEGTYAVHHWQKQWRMPLWQRLRRRLW